MLGSIVTYKSCIKKVGMSMTCQEAVSVSDVLVSIGCVGVCMCEVCVPWWGRKISSNAPVKRVRH